MNKKVLITGATGFIAQRLISALHSKGYALNTLSRKRISDSRFSSYTWDIETQQIEEAAFIDVGIIIHLAGENVGGKSWSQQQKSRIVQSRVQSTKLLHDVLAQKKLVLDCYIGASATGIYGNANEQELNENAAAGDTFLANTCVLWEKAHQAMIPFTKRMITARIPMVLDSKEGAFPKLLISYPLSFNYFGSGKQYMPWIHIEDLCKVFLYFVENAGMSGVFNINAPENSDQKTFTQTLALIKNPFCPVFGIPASIIKLSLGESASLVLDGQRCSSAKLTETGFNFQYPTIKECLIQLLR